VVQDFAIPLASSGLLGPGCSKYLPISNVTDLRLDLIIENAIQAVCGSGNWHSFVYPEYIYREARLELMDTMGVRIPNYYKRINNPKM